VNTAGEMTVGNCTALVITTPAGWEGEARRELRRVLPGAQARPLLLKGNIVVLTQRSEEEALALIAEAETRCVARVIPVQRQVRVAPEAASLALIAPAVVEVGRLRVGDTFLVRCRRRGEHEWNSGQLERLVAHELERLTGAVGDYEGEVDWLVTVQVYQDIAYLGVVKPERVLQKVPREQRKYAPGQRPLNRAQWKIREALEAFAIHLPQGAWVLDLGSAPGGWALVLAELAERVVAVDPGELDPRAAGHPRIEHIQCRAEELAGREDLQGRFDLLTCDMNLDPSEAAPVVCRLAPALKPDARAVMTVKYTTVRRRQHERAAREILAAEYDEIRMRRLPHNARETTAAMRRREPAGRAPK